MEAIKLEEFSKNFMEISNNLTLAELRLLYLLITEPNVINLSRLEIANKLGVDRRTIWLSFDKLQKSKYIWDINIPYNNLILTSSNKKDHQSLLSQYSLKRKKKDLINLLEIYPSKFPSTLFYIRDYLPENINDLAIKYGFQELLSFVLKHNRLRGKPQELKQVGFLAYSDKYREYSVKWRKTKLLRQLIINEPLSVKIFLNCFNDETQEEIQNELKVLVKELYEFELLELLKWCENL